MHDISMDYVSSVVQAAEAVRDGATRGFGIGGGLHHAQREKASGFCVYNDPAIAVHILRERFDRVAYVDIDVHHGDGVENIFALNPSVLTISIHEDGRTLFPGTGAFEDQGLGQAVGSALNLPLPRGTTGVVWLELFKRVVPNVVAAFGAQAVVLQMGTDPHPEDRLGHLEVGFAEWLEAVRVVHGLDLPIVAVGGGGYNLLTVPRMWTAACLTLGNIEFEDELPEDLAAEWGVPTFSDPHPVRHSKNSEAAQELLKRIRAEHPLGRAVK
jgi:acetoin utilization protein AcuC